MLRGLVWGGWLWATLALALAVPTPKERVEEAIAKAKGSSALTALHRTATEARLTYWLAMYSDTIEEKNALFDRGLKLADGIHAEHSNDPDVLIAWIALKGGQLQIKSKLVALTYISPLEKAALRLKAIAPTFKEYAADRILGRMYHLAPSFISIGSAKKARQHFESAFAGAPENPENLLFYADFLASQGEKARAIEMVKKALASPRLNDYPIERAYWELLGQGWLTEWQRS